MASPNADVKVQNYNGVEVTQLYTGCLAHAGYLIVSNGEAAIVDPMRDGTQYEELLAAKNAKAKFILETHFHADFVSGHVDLHTKLGAEVVFGPTAQPGFDAKVCADHEVLKVGNVSIKILHTPGHTMESSCFLLSDAEGKDVAVFTGDTLFIGDVGRPDLAQKAANMTQEQLAEHLFNSLRTQVMTLADDVVVYPGHGAGSACGKSLSTETISTIGKQKLTNYALRANMTSAEFVQELTDGLTPPPEYFPHSVAMNKATIEPVEKLIARGNVALSLEKIDELMKQSPAPLLVDTRHQLDFTTKGHIPSSLFCGLDEGNFAPWIGTAFADDTRQIILVLDNDADATKAIVRLARIGFDACIGYVAGGVETWVKAGRPLNKIEEVAPEQLAEILKANGGEMAEGQMLVDVRMPGENRSGAVKAATNISLQRRNFDKVDTDKKEIFAYCKEGYRSLLFLSSMIMRGVDASRVRNITGGYFGMLKAPAMQEYLVATKPCGGKVPLDQAPTCNKLKQ